MKIHEPYRVGLRYTTINLWDYQDKLALSLTSAMARDLARKLNAAAREADARVNRYSKGQLGRTS